MKIIAYATASKYGFERQSSEVDFRKRMKELHQEKVPFTPRVLVEGLPGKSKAEWLNLNTFNRIKKKGGDVGNGNNSY